MTSKQQQQVQLQYTLKESDTYWTAAFSAMASPCEILMDCETASEAHRLASLAVSETARIERKYSRYRSDSVVSQINTSDGVPVVIDDETAQLLRYAAECYKLSDGAFDITSGVLRRAWQFNGQEAEPDTDLIKSLLSQVGWDKVTLTDSTVLLHPDMEIDLGGIGKEYAVDRVAQMLFEALPVSLMVNFGGDIRAIANKSRPQSWVVGIEDPSKQNEAVGTLSLEHGAVATSGDAARFCMVNGKRLGHILDPRTGWPVEDAPRSVTVVADLCTEAGLLATLSMLQGSEAEEFLAAQSVTYHCIR
jgi:thiamine biosynthesis lipoprotein